MKLSYDKPIKSKVVAGALSRSCYILEDSLSKLRRHSTSLITKVRRA